MQCRSVKLSYCLRDRRRRFCATSHGRRRVEPVDWISPASRYGGKRITVPRELVASHVGRSVRRIPMLRRSAGYRGDNGTNYAALDVRAALTSKHDTLVRRAPGWQVAPDGQQAKN